MRKHVLWLMVVIGIGLVVYPIIYSYIIAPNKIEKTNQVLLTEVSAEDIKKNKEKQLQQSEDVFDLV